MDQKEKKEVAERIIRRLKEGGNNGDSNGQRESKSYPKCNKRS